MQVMFKENCIIPVIGIINNHVYSFHQIKLEFKIEEAFSQENEITNSLNLRNVIMILIIVVSLLISDL